MWVCFYQPLYIIIYGSGGYQTPVSVARLNWVHATRGRP
jgi:hypothetical protein